MLLTTLAISPRQSIPRHAPACERVRGRHAKAERGRELLARYVAPSNATGSNALDVLERYSKVLPDGLASEGDQRLDTAYVSFALLSSVLANPAAYSTFTNAIEQGVARASEVMPGNRGAALDHALVRIGTLLAERVEGRIVTEVDPRVANDSGELARRARYIVQLYKDCGVPRAQLLISLPATWEGIEAAAALESEDIQCEVTSVYSLAQAALAVQSGASVLRTNIGRINTWYKAHPNAIRDSKVCTLATMAFCPCTWPWEAVMDRALLTAGPRQDAGYASEVRVGVRLAADIYAYARQTDSAVALVVTGIMSAEEAVQLSGADYLVVPDAVLASLKAQATMEGYNDGLIGGGDGEAGMPQLSADFASTREFGAGEIAATEDSFARDIGMAADELLRQRLASAQAAAAKAERYIGDVAFSRE